MLGDSPGTTAADVEKAKRWAVVLVGGAAVQQVGWWSLYSELGLWCGLLGGAAVLVGAFGFDRVAGHSEDWQLQPTAQGGNNFSGWILVFYAVAGAAATVLSAAFCPALGTDEGWRKRADHGDLGPATCGYAAVCAGLSLLLLVVLLCVVGGELVAMGRAAQ